VGPTAVFDTNILFSATGWRGSPFQCVELARAGKVEAATCPELVEELAEKLETKLGFSPEQSAETLDAVSRDPEDNAVLECALESKAEFVISGDEDLLVLKIFRGVQIVRAREFLDILAKRVAK
jgi:uncharacterized protein